MFLFVVEALVYVAAVVVGGVVIVVGGVLGGVGVFWSVVGLGVFFVLRYGLWRGDFLVGAAMGMIMALLLANGVGVVGVGGWAGVVVSLVFVVSLMVVVVVSFWLWVTIIGRVLGVRAASSSHWSCCAFIL